MKTERSRIHFFLATFSPPSPSSDRKVLNVILVSLALRSTLTRIKRALYPAKYRHFSGLSY